MKRRERRIQEEAAALWRALRDDAPPADAGGDEMLTLVLRDLPAAAYERLNSPHLRPAAISMPRPARSGGPRP